MQTDRRDLLWDELDHWLYHAIGALLEKHLKLEPCPAIALANEECGPMAQFIKKLVEEELKCRSKASS